MRIRTVLVPTDFSPTSDAALAYALDLAAHHGASVHLLHVVDDPFAPGALAAEACLGDSHGVRTSITDEAKARLARRLAHGRAGVVVTGEVVFGGAADIIVEYAAARPFDLIV